MGGVSPSYGLALTSIKFDGWDPARCPEPPRVAIPGDHGLVRGITCRTCGEALLPWNLLPGISCVSWELWRAYEATGHYHQPPLPTCGRPPARTRVWSDGQWIDVHDDVIADANGQLALI